MDDITQPNRPGRWVEIVEAGIECRFWIDDEPDSIQAEIANTRTFYEIEPLRLAHELLPSSARVVDVGANIGNHSVFFSRICNAEWVLPIEPNLDVLPQLRGNLAANGCSAADLSQLGVAAGAARRTGAMRLDGADRAIRNRGGARLVSDVGEEETLVEVVPLDEIVDGHVDLVKLDVEGMALEVLEGANRMIERSQPIVVVEVGVEEMPGLFEWAWDARYQAIAAFADYPGLTNLVLRPAARVPTGALSVQDAEAKIARALARVAATSARADRANATAELASSAAAEAHAHAEVAERRLAESTELAELLEARSLTAEAHAEVAERRLAESTAQRDDAVSRADEAERAAAAERLEVARLRGIEESLTWRATYPLRRLLELIPSAVRLRLRSLGRRAIGAVPNPARDGVRPTARIADPSPEAKSARAPSRPAAERPGKSASLRRALFVDDRWPEPDRDSGSVDAMNLLTELVRLNYDTTFFSTVPSRADDYRRQLEQLGVTCLRAGAVDELNTFLETEGNTLDVCILSRVQVGGHFFEQVRRLAGRARVVFNAVDLHHLRDEREARLRGDRVGIVLAAATRERELYLVRQADATIVVSSLELRLLESAVPGARVFELPLLRPVHPPKTGFALRNGVGFIGGFAHLPNVDAVKFFLDNIWPSVQAELPDCRFVIAGPDLPTGLVTALPEGVRYAGHVDDLEAWFEGVRLTVAPLRYGAGAKGKVASSLAHGVPCVATPIAAEGMRLGAGHGVVIGKDPRAFARGVVDLYVDELKWSTLSQAAVSFAEENLGVVAWRSRLVSVLDALDLPSVPLSQQKVAGKLGPPG
ncbi:MAG TPA: FkbM family methyltransferase [Thermoanaerobaculia bacterium]|nr:FkbM family methyltransferase [Thermoanaerobaculia bacterium]